MKILALDSTGKTASVAILDGETLLGETFIHTGFTHSETLMPLVEQLLQITGTAMSDIGKLAVTMGPGSFTGIRIGIATVKGLAFPQEIPCVALSTLEVLAAGAEKGNYLICPAMDARRNQVYTALFKWQGDCLVRVWEDKAMAVTELCEALEAMGEEVYLLGDGAELCQGAFVGRVATTLAPQHIRYQRALYAALLSKTRESISAAEVSPVYLRLSQAERENLEIGI